MSKLLSNTTWWLNIDWEKVANFLFIDKDNKFQWIGVSAVFAVVVFFFNTSWEHHKLNAEIKSKSRIQWMNTVREYIVDYTIAAQDLDLALRKMLAYKARHEVQRTGELTNEEGFVISIEDYESELTARNDVVNLSSRAVSKTRGLLMLYITNSKSERALVKNIQDLADYLQVARSKVGSYKEGTQIEGQHPNDYAETLQKDIENRINLLTETARDYMKNEWERAKKGQ